MWQAFVESKKGVTIIEYGLIGGIIAIGLVAVLGDIGTGLNTVFTTISTSV